MDQKRTVFEQQLDRFSSGETIHQVANLKATYLLAIGLYLRDECQVSVSLVRESEAEIKTFLRKARSRAMMFL